MANVVIDIAAEFTGNKAFKQAETSTDKLIRGVKKLAAATGLAFGTAQIIAFGKASVKAALDAQAQQQRLASLVRVTVGATDSQIQSLNEQAQALQEIGVVNKENITQTQSQLATFNLQIDTIKALTPAILDYVTAEKGAAASADEFKSMTNGLAQALNGNFASLTKVGFVLDDVTKKTIKNGTEAERAAALVAVLDSTYKDFNKNLALTDAGQMQILANAADDASENIGVGLIDALKTLGKDNSVENLANDMERASLGAADFIRGLAEITSFSINGDTKSLIGLLTTPFKRSLAAGPLGFIARQGVKTGDVKAADNAHLKSLQNQFVVIKKTTDLNKKLTADELKKLKTAKLKLAIDKANLALNKGEEVFDMDKIQIAAALTNQAEQLGKATSTAQVLQIANDTARLNVKQSILALEDAIAAKDATAIIAANLKLSEDLKILGALTGQKNQVAAIESILKGLVPKDLIDQKNLDLALLKIKQMLDELAKFKWPTMPNVNLPTGGGGGGTGGGGGGGGTGGGGTGGTGGTGGGLGGTGTGGLLGGKTAEQLAQEAALKKFYEDELARRAAEKAAAEAAAKAAAEALASVGKGITEVGIVGEKVEKIAQGNTIESILEYADAATERANAIAGLLEQANAQDMAILTANALANRNLGLQLFQQDEYKNLLPTGNGSVGGGIGAFDRDINITVNTGVGDPNAIAEAIENLLREANARGTLTSGILGIA